MERARERWRESRRLGVRERERGREEKRKGRGGGTRKKENGNDIEREREREYIKRKDRERERERERERAHQKPRQTEKILHSLRWSGSQRGEVRCSEATQREGRTAFWTHQMMKVCLCVCVCVCPL